jgi:hypothetical protein
MVAEARECARDGELYGWGGVPVRDVGCVA